MSVQGFPDEAVLWIDGLPKADGLQWASTHMLLTWMQSKGKWDLSSLPDGWQDHPSLPVLGLTASATLGVQFADSRSGWREFSISIILIIHLFLGSSVSTFISSSILLALFLWRTLIPAPRLVLLHRFALKPNYWDRAAKQWVLGLAVSKERVGLGSRQGSSSEKSHACSPPPPNHNQLGKQRYFQMQPPPTSFLDSQKPTSWLGLILSHLGWCTKKRVHEGVSPPTPRPWPCVGPFPKPRWATQHRDPSTEWKCRCPWSNVKNFKTQANPSWAGDTRWLQESQARMLALP